MVDINDENKPTTDEVKDETTQAQQTNKILPPLLISAQYIKDLSFEAPGMPQVLLEVKQAPTLEVNVDITAQHLKDNQFEVVLKIKVQAKTKNENEEDKTLFVCELAYGALVLVNVPKEHIEAILLVEVPRLLFPFARQIISNLSHESALPPIVLAPIDFFALFRARKEQQMQAASKEQAPNNTTLN